MSMRFVKIQGISQPISNLILGSTMLSDERMDFCTSLLDKYVELGGNAIDTAHGYGPHGMRAIGRWMEVRNNRSQIVIVCKVAHPSGDVRRVTKEDIENDLIESLGRMQTDYIDILMLHRDDTDKSVGYILEGMQEQLEAGRCRALAVSNWTAERFDAANDYAAVHGLIGFVCNSPNLSLAKPNEARWPGCIAVDADYAAWHERSQMPLLSWSSQAGGFFTGRFAPDKLDDPDTVRVYYSAANWERYRRASELAVHKGADANQVALAYVLHQPFPICALIGPGSLDELHSSAEALKIRLTPEEMKWLNLELDRL